MIRSRKAKEGIRTPSARILKGYCHSAGADLSCAIRDLEADLIHLCNLSSGLRRPNPPGREVYRRGVRQDAH